MFEGAIRAYFAANVALLAILGATLAFQEPETGGYVVTILALAVVVPSVVVSGALIYFDVDLRSIGGG